MKCPETLTLIRHAKSVYNGLRAQKDSSPLYQTFRESYEISPESDNTRRLAVEVKEAFALGVGDRDTPLAEDIENQTKRVGEKLKDIIKVPDVIFVSPYLRTRLTLDKLTEGWPELKDVKTVEEEDIREQEYGLFLIYGDWRVFNVFHPEQIELRKIQGEYQYRYPQGENVHDVRKRLRPWIKILRTDYTDKNILAVTHHLTILSIRANIEALNADAFIRLNHEEKPINNGVTIYRRDPTQGSDGELILEQYNIKLY